MSRKTKQRRKKRRERIKAEKAARANAPQLNIFPIDHEKVARRFSCLTFRGGATMRFKTFGPLVEASTPDELKVGVTEAMVEASANDNSDEN